MLRHAPYLHCIIQKFVVVELFLLQAAVFFLPPGIRVTNHVSYLRLTSSSLLIFTTVRPTVSMRSRCIAEVLHIFLVYSTRGFHTIPSLWPRSPCTVTAHEVTADVDVLPPLCGGGLRRRCWLDKAVVVISCDIAQAAAVIVRRVLLLAGLVLSQLQLLVHVDRDLPHVAGHQMVLPTRGICRLGTCQGQTISQPRGSVQVCGEWGRGRRRTGDVRGLA